MPEKREEKGLVDTVVFEVDVCVLLAMILQRGVGILNAYFFYVHKKERKTATHCTSAIRNRT